MLQNRNSSRLSIIHTLIFPTATYKYGSWTLGKADGGKMGSVEMWYFRRALQIPWTTRKRKKWILEQIKLETLLEAKMTN